MIFSFFSFYPAALIQLVAGLEEGEEPSGGKVLLPRVVEIRFNDAES
jgi:hypothetical protein